MREQVGFDVFSLPGKEKPHLLWQAIANVHCGANHDVIEIRKINAEAGFLQCAMHERTTAQYNVLFDHFVTTRRVAGCGGLSEPALAAHYVARLDPQRFSSFKAALENDALGAMSGHIVVVRGDAATISRDIWGLRVAVWGDWCRSPFIAVSAYLYN